MKRLLSSRSLVAAALSAALLAGGFAWLGPARAMPGHHGGPRADGAPGMPMMMGSPRHLDRLLEDIGASADQRQQVRGILDAAASDLRAQRQSDRSLREQGLQLFQAPNVDAAAAEAWRRQAMARHDQASQRMLQAMLDVAKVLTSEQRRQLGERIAEWGAMASRHRGERAPAERSAR